MFQNEDNSFMFLGILFKILAIIHGIFLINRGEYRGK